MNETAWELVHPRCALERADDMKEVAAMLDAGETEVARDEIRWLLEGCSDFLQAHLALGEMALAEGDVNLARGHFGTAYQIGVKALRRVGLDRPLPYRRTANRPFFEAGKGLVYCLVQLDRQRIAREVVEQLLRCDPTDPLGVRALITGGEPPAPSCPA